MHRYEAEVEKRKEEFAAKEKARKEAEADLILQEQCVIDCFADFEKVGAP